MHVAADAADPDHSNPDARFSHLRLLSALSYQRSAISVRWITRSGGNRGPGDRAPVADRSRLLQGSRPVRRQIAAKRGLVDTFTRIADNGSRVPIAPADPWR